LPALRQPLMSFLFISLPFFHYFSPAFIFDCHVFRAPDIDAAATAAIFSIFYATPPLRLAMPLYCHFQRQPYYYAIGFISFSFIIFASAFRAAPCHCRCHAAAS